MQNKNKPPILYSSKAFKRFQERLDRTLVHKSMQKSSQNRLLVASVMNLRCLEICVATNYLSQKYPLFNVKFSVLSLSG